MVLGKASAARTHLVRNMVHGPVPAARSRGGDLVRARRGLLQSGGGISGSLVGRSNGPGSMSSPPTTFFFCPHTKLPLPIPFSPRLLNKLNVSPQDTQTSVRVMCVGPRIILKYSEDRPPTPEEARAFPSNTIYQVPTDGIVAIRRLTRSVGPKPSPKNFQEMARKSREDRRAASRSKLDGRGMPPPPAVTLVPDAAMAEAGAGFCAESDAGAGAGGGVRPVAGEAAP